MSDGIKGYHDDVGDYINLCERFGVEPQRDERGYPDPYGEHAQALAVADGGYCKSEPTAVLHEIRIERARQDQKWGGAEHDDTYGPNDWHSVIDDYNGWARRMALMGSLDKARRRYVQIAALAVAAVETIDRCKSNNEVRREAEPQQP